MNRNLLTINFVLNVLAINICTYSFSGYKNYVYDPNDFAAEVINYAPAGMYNHWLTGEPYDKPLNALGRPTVDTAGDGIDISPSDIVPVNPVYVPFLPKDIVWLGNGGYIILKFNRPVRDEVNNPYGVDFIVFGNTPQTIGSGNKWLNGDPSLTTVSGGGTPEPAIVSVSQDGQTWYSFTRDPNFMENDTNFIKLPPDSTDGPFADSFAPTLGRVYDPELPDTTIGNWNKWWSSPTNPTLPINPSLSFSDFGSMTVAGMAQMYGYSAGGTGFDISRLAMPIDPQTGLKWFQYVRVDDKLNDGYTAEVDAVSAVTSCGDLNHPFPPGDLNGDCRVDMNDVALLSSYWISVGLPSYSAEELLLVVDYWLDCTWDCYH